MTNQSHVGNGPFDAYEGDDEPFIFISYKHSDWKIVYPMIERINNAGFNIWYDAGLRRGPLYDTQIFDHIKDSVLFVTIITNKVIDCASDEEDYVVKELYMSLTAKKRRLAIYLDDVELDGPYAAHYSGRQSIYRSHYVNEDEFIDECIRAFRDDFKIKQRNDVENSSLDSMPEEKNISPSESSELNPENVAATNEVDLDNSYIKIRPFPAYDGDEPYIFATYSHKDADIIFPELNEFRNAGYNIWYDPGIVPGMEWVDAVADALERCSLFVCFISKNSLASDNVINEIKFADDENKDIILIYLDDVELSGGLKLRLRNQQAILKFSMTDEEYSRQWKKAFGRYISVNANFETGADIGETDVSSEEGNNGGLFGFLKEDDETTTQDLENNLAGHDNERYIMETGTIDYGIDLGITNSCIAKVDGNSTIVIPNKTDNKNYVASAVYIKKNGTVFVGDKAKNKMATDPKNGYAEFRLRMGSDHVYEFERSGLKKTPVELSAEILKNLRASVKQIDQKDLRAAVITVPADFTAPQTQATTEAAKLAGFQQIILLQEPIAAAMAYGMGNLKTDEIWMVYDFGGLSFDVSLIKKSGDDIMNINNSGDEYLGGKLIDWDIVDKIFVPAIVDELGLTDFNRSNEKYIKQFAKLKKAAERAKADVFIYDSAEVEIEVLFIDADGDVFDFEYEMTREELESVMEPYVNRTILHCRKALDDVNLSPLDVTKIILVGDSSFDQYVRKRLEQEFNIPYEDSINPTTVVARGAAVYAGTKFLDIINENPESGSVSLELMYETIGEDIEFFVSGKVIVPDNSSAGYSIEFVNNQTGYSSGRVPVADNGFFTTDLLAEDEDGYNIYQIRVYNASGNIAKLAPNCVNTVKYKIDVVPDRPKLSHAIGFGKFGNELDIIAPKGVELPFFFRKTYEIPNTIHKGNASEEIYMPLYQGNRARADRNTLIGHLRITGADIKDDLPAGSEIELSVSIDESMSIDSSVYIECLDQEFDDGMGIVSEKKSRDDLVMEFESHQSRYENILAESADTDNVQIQNYLYQIKSESMIDNIETSLKDAETDSDALDNASRRINDFANILDIVEEILESEKSWGEVKGEADELISDIESKIDKAEPQIKELYEQMKGMYNSAVETRNVSLLTNVNDKLKFIYARTHEDEIVIFAFRELASSGDFTDQSLADELIQKGNDAVVNANISELRSIVGRLYHIQKHS